MHKTKLAASVAIVSLFFGNFALAAESNKDIDTNSINIFSFMILT